MTLIDKIKHHLESESLSQAKVAQAAGINAGALSSYLSGNYKGDHAKLEQALENYFNRLATKAREFVEAPQFIETTTAKQIFKALDFAQIANCINVIYGASGVGKTKALQEYTARHPHNVWLITASPCRATLVEILYEMGLEVGIPELPRNKGKLARLLRKKLSHTQGLIIIDEADHLPYDALEELRIMQEETGVGMVLVGNDKVYNRLRGGVHHAHEFARLWSRIAKRVSIQKCKQADVKQIAEAWNLAHDSEAMKVMHSIAEMSGGLRILTQTLRLAAMAAKGKESVITAELISAARTDLGLTNA